MLEIWEESWTPCTPGYMPIPKCPFVRVARWFDFTSFFTEIKNYQQYVVLYTEASRTLVVWSGIPEKLKSFSPCSI